MSREEFLLKLKDDRKFLKESNEHINKIMEMMEKGYDNDKIRGAFRKTKYLEEMTEFAKSRIKVRRKFSRYDQLWMDTYSASYSTPEIPAIYRSEKLRGRKILDAGSGAGMQSIFFSTNSKVTGVDLNMERVYMAQLNAMAYDSNANFIHGDIFQLGDVGGKYDTVFSDPLRGKTSEERFLEELSPNPLDILEYFSGVVGNFVFDLPPMIRQDKLSRLNGELEYLSLNGALQRLTSYSGSERKYSAVMLPSGLSFSSPKVDKNEDTGGNWSEILFVPDPSLFYSHLENQYCLSKGMKPVQREKRKSIFTAEGSIADSMGEYFRVVKSGDYEVIKKFLKGSKFGKIYLKYDSPDYYGEKNNLENGLTGNHSGYIFKIREEFVLCEKI